MRRRLRILRGKEQIPEGKKDRGTFADPRLKDWDGGTLPHPPMEDLVLPNSVVVPPAPAPAPVPPTFTWRQRFGIISSEIRRVRRRFVNWVLIRLRLRPVQVVTGRRVTMPLFELVSNPTVRLSDVRERRFAKTLQEITEEEVRQRAKSRWKIIRNTATCVPIV